MHLRFLTEKELVRSQDNECDVAVTSYSAGEEGASPAIGHREVG